MKYKILIFLLLIFYSAFSVAQNTSKEEKNNKKKVKPLYGADRMPKFPYGTDALTKFMYENLRYEELVKVNKIEGKVILEFVVDVDGSISDIMIKKSLDKAYDEEAIRIVSAMPKWEPGLQNYNPVAVYYILPIIFPPVKPKSFEKADTIKNIVNIKDTTGKINNDKPYTIAEVMPRYPGGVDALMLFLHENIMYPKEAIKNGTQGTEVLQFVVNKDGSISNVKVLRGIGDGCDEEAIRVVKAMPKWLPGTQDGVAVPVYFQIPMKFTIK